MKVKAMAKGQYKGVMQYAGDIFEIEDSKEMADWMKEVVVVPLRVSGTMLPNDADFDQPKTDE